MTVFYVEIVIRHRCGGSARFLCLVLLYWDTPINPL
jgi:hypothetical protein